MTGPEVLRYSILMTSTAELLQSIAFVVMAVVALVYVVGRLVRKTS